MEVLECPTPKPDIPDQAIMWRVEHGVQCNRELHGAETHGKVAAHATDRMNEITAQFVRYGRKIGSA